MDKVLRFSDYDVFGCLTAGLAAFAIYDLVAETNFVLGANWSVSDTVVLIAAAYIIGQILAAPSAWLLERELVFKLLGRPSAVLVRERRPSGWRGKLAKTVLGEYYTPLHSSVRERLRIAAGANFDDPESLFHLAYPTTMRLPLVRAKLETFLRLYGFCRNMAFVGLVATVVLAAKATVLWIATGWWSAAPVYGLTGAALVMSLGIFHRYLKFLRLYGLTTLTSFASGGSASNSIGGKPDDED